MPLTHFCSHSSVRRWTQSTHVFSYTQKWDGLLKVDHWPEFLSYNAAPEISFRKTVTTGSTFHWHRMGHKTCLLVWHIQPVQRTQSVTSGENDNCVPVGRSSGCIQSQTRIMGAMSEFWDFWHVSNISRDSERDWARAFFLLAGAWPPISAFQRVWALLPNHKRPPNWERMDPRPFVKKPGESTLSC